MTQNRFHCHKPSGTQSQSQRTHSKVQAPTQAISNTSEVLRQSTGVFPLVLRHFVAGHGSPDVQANAMLPAKMAALHWQSNFNQLDGT